MDELSDCQLHKKDGVARRHFHPRRLSMVPPAVVKSMSVLKQPEFPSFSEFVPRFRCETLRFNEIGLNV